ncbi:hypothetical protein H4R34_003385 [Dimargaris verticillata]|uniref:TFIIS N-terminal domain-containing protein n=1 Tax=Dimargaris verticillata TaxID=2761393 RepID=A0A9W8B0Y2_9FUNG|nr:hypothetical protein H4R34_003385 [Dimargaris verticillata]
MPLNSYEADTLGWLNEDCLEDYESNYEKHTAKQKGKKDPQFHQALAQAKDPKVLDKELQRRMQESKDAGESEDDASSAEEQGDGETVPESKASRSKGGRKRQSPSTPTQTTPASKRRSTARQTQSARGERVQGTKGAAKQSEAATTSKKKRTNGAKQSEPESPSASRGCATAEPLVPEDKVDAMSVDAKGASTPDSSSNEGQASFEESSNPRINELRRKLQHRSLYDCLMCYRHRIQKALLKDDIPDDLSRADAAFTELEHTAVTLVHLQETKILKLMKRIYQMVDIPNDTYNLRQRALQLVNKWRRETTELSVRDQQDRGSPGLLASPLLPLTNGGLGQSEPVTPTKDDKAGSKPTPSKSSSTEPGDSDTAIHDATPAPLTEKSALPESQSTPTPRDSTPPPAQADIRGAQDAKKEAAVTDNTGHGSDHPAPQRSPLASPNPVVSSAALVSDNVAS